MRDLPLCRTFSLAMAFLAFAGQAAAQPAPSPSAGPPAKAVPAADPAAAPPTPAAGPAPPTPATAAKPAAPIEVAVTGNPSERGSKPGRFSSKIDRRTLDERMPRSAPDALRYEAGVHVQQTSSAQGSPFVRGRTGQQTVLLYDGIRLNTSTYRQGPNQYFFTVDPHTVYALEVIRGGSSTEYGSDALGGVIEVKPMEPALELGATRPVVRPRVAIRAGTADDEIGYRFQLDTQVSEKLRFLGGVGSRKVGLLESGGPIYSPATGAIALVPRLAADGRTQLGTGYREFTGDMRAVYGLGEDRRLVAAVYAYQQYDAPRTDQCPAPQAVESECLKYDEQFRTLVYVGYRGDVGPLAKSSQISFSYQRQHEKRTNNRPKSFVVNGYRDDVDTFGVTAKLETAPWEAASWLRGRLRYGLDAYFDSVESSQYTRLTDLDLTVEGKRGLYVAGSAYKQGGAFAELEAQLFEARLIVRGGARAGFAHAFSPGTCDSKVSVCDTTSSVPDAEPLSRTWPTVAGNAGVEYRPLRALSLVANYDRSYRAPNLDDLTAFGLTGAGLQSPNQALEPEQGDTFETGVRVGTLNAWPGAPVAVEADFWLFRSILHDAITRESLGKGFVRLVNVAGASTIDGFEAAARVTVPLGFVARGTVAYTYGEGPNPADPTEIVPLSRMPPLNGTAELRWQSPFDVYLAGAMRWSLAQTRLAITDIKDKRIPTGGTPGFVVFELRAGYRFKRNFQVAAVLENLGDVAYRYHGSSINGPGRSLSVSLEGGL
jgi:outer membrane receptor protein involved in Fe transport